MINDGELSVFSVRTQMSEVFFLQKPRCTRTARTVCIVVYTRFLMKLFRTSSMEIIAECQHYFGFSLPSKLIERKRNKFVNNYKNVSLL